MRTETRTSTTILAILLLGLAGPLAAAQPHGLPVDPSVPSQPTAPPPPPEQTNLPPVVNRGVGGTYGTVTQAYNGTGAQYRVIQDTVNPLLNRTVPRELVVYRDGAGNASSGPDRRFAGFGPVRAFGASPWVQAAGAARTGAQGYSSPVLGDGTYPTNTRSLLLTPEIDLRVGIPTDATMKDFQDATKPWRDEVRGQCRAGVGNILVPLCVLYPNMYWKGVGEGGYGAIYNSLLGRGVSSDAEARLTFQARYNLGGGDGVGRDGVALMVFTQPPTEMPSSYGACTGPCIPVGPSLPTYDPTSSPAVNECPKGEKYFGVLIGLCINPPAWNYNASVASLDGQPGFTGYADWNTYSVDLTPWIGQSVWVGFYFAAQNLPPSNYFSSPLFAPQAGFYGFQLDDLVATAPATPDNLQVRPLQPVAPRVYRQEVPMLLPGAPVQVRTEVRNVGVMGARIRIHTQVVDFYDPQRIYNQNVSQPLQLNSSDIAEVHISYPAPPLGATAVASVLVERLSDGFDPAHPLGNAFAPRAAADQALRGQSATPCGIHDNAARVVQGLGLPKFESLITPTDQAGTMGTGRSGLLNSMDLMSEWLGQVGQRILCDPQVGDAEPRDDAAMALFQVQRVHAILAGEVTRSANQLQPGDTLQYTVALRNDGNTFEDFTLAATAYEVSDPKNPVVVDIVPFDQVQKGVQLAPGESTKVQWSIRGDLPGQYRLFVHDTRDEGFNATLDLLTPSLAPIEVPFVDLPTLGNRGTMSMDGRVDEWAWSLATPFVAMVRDPKSEAEGHLPLRMFHDGANLYVGAVRPPTIIGDFSNPVYGAITALFHDGGDPLRRMGGVDGIYVERASALRAFDLHLDPATHTFAKDADQGDLAGRADATAATRALNNFEFSRPLHAGGQDIDLDADGMLTFYLNLTVNSANNGPPDEYHYPREAHHRDGGLGRDDLALRGVMAPDGLLADEMDGWSRLRLLPPGEPRAPLRVFLPGFGVDRNSPPIFQETLEACPDGRGWGQDGVLHKTYASDEAFFRKDDRITEKWNCGPLVPGGPPAFFQGMEQSSLSHCGGGPCPPFSLAGWNRPGILYTPPIGMENVDSPWLVFFNQVSGLVRVCDGPVSVPSPDGRLTCLLGDMQKHGPNINVLATAWVFLEVWDPHTQQWTGNTPLWPEGGYSSEDSTGLADPARNGLPGRAWLSACQGMPKEMCGWWDPTGFIPGYRPQNDTIAVGAGFHGSPWRVSRIPLFGLHGPDGVTPVDVNGQTIRLGFAFLRPPVAIPYRADHEAPFDLGWRIGAMAVMEAPRYLLDVSLADVRVATANFDPQAIGVAPDTDLPVVVTVANEGLREARRLKVQVTGFDPTKPEGEENVSCTSPLTPLPGLLLPRFTQNVTVPCRVTAAEGLLRLRAEVVAEEGDEFIFNNHRTRADAFPVRTSPDVAVLLDASPQVASEETTRRIFLSVENRGNVPLSGFDVLRTVRHRLASGNALLDDFTRLWRVQGELGIGQTLRIEDPALDVSPPVGVALEFRPPTQGQYDVVAQAFLPGDGNPGDNLRSTSLKALRELYFDNFDEPRVMDPAVVSGALKTDGTGWDFHSEGDAHGRHLTAGEPGTGRIPLGTDAGVMLPPMDLTALSSASLSIRHRYDLERHFDAGRVEASTDKGKTWIPLRPKPQELAGLPEGYPSLAVFGPSPLLGNETEASAVAYTGRSGDLVGVDLDGYVASEFNLVSHPDLRRVAQLEAFRYEGFAPYPSPQPIVAAEGQEVRFQHPSWGPEGGGDALARSWWIENVTRSDPNPHSGSTMWWSGFAGEASPQHPPTQLCNGLGTRLDLQAVPTTQNRILLSWWEWRSGWQDDPLRQGRGGLYAVSVQRQDNDKDGIPDAVEIQQGSDPDKTDTDGDGFTDGAELYWTGTGPLADDDDDKLYDPWERKYFGNVDLTTIKAEADPDQDGLTNLQEQTYGTDPRPAGADTDLDGVWDGIEVGLGTDPRARLEGQIVEELPDGWTRRVLDLTPYRSEAVDLLFHYSWQESSLTPGIHGVADFGWFIDDVDVVAWIEAPGGNIRHSPLSVLPMQDMDLLDLDPATLTAGPWKTLVTDPKCSPAAWRLVGRGPAATPTGWHMEEDVAVPGSGKSSVWRFSGPNQQGYPHLADARLVTPPIDLSLAEGDNARLRFTHKYGFEAKSVAPAGDAAGAMTVAIDGGVVEFQVLDEATGQYGPWRQLFKEFRNAPDRALFTTADRGGRIAPTGLVQDTPLPGQLGNREKVAASGYPAVALRGTDWLTTHPILQRSYGGHGLSFEVFPGKIQHPTLSWQDYPASYLFSGASTGIDGWREETLDISPLIGKQVRFAFHAATNPGFGGLKPLPFAGWAIAGVAVEGEVFSGKPVQVRFRVATDGSLAEGSWNVDDLLVAGTPFTRNLVVRLDGPERLVLPGETLDLYANVTNLGDTPRSGLALAVEVLDQATKAQHPGYELLLPDPDVTIDPKQVVAAFSHTLVVGPHALGPSNALGNTLPVHIRLTMPANASRLQVRLTVLEADGELGQATYRVPGNQVRGGIQAAWDVAGNTLQDLRLVRPHPDNVGFVVATPGNGVKGQPVSLQAGLVNQGTTVPGVVAHWRLEEIKRKGPPTQQGMLGAEEIGFKAEWSDDLGLAFRGQTLFSTFNRTPPRDGLYRASVAFHADGVPATSARLEFLVGPGGVYYQVDFANTSGQSGWRDASPAVNPSTGGGTPPESQWREFDGRLIWGVTAAQAAAGATYCTTPNAACHGTNQGGSTGPPEPTTYYGMEGVAVSPWIHLTRVPDGNALLTLRNGHHFETDDGGRIESRPLKTPADPAAPVAAFTCADGSDAWFKLEPVRPEDYAARALSRGFEKQLPALPGGTPYTMPTRLNPLAPQFAPEPVLGGPPVASQTLQFDLSRPVRALCPELPDTRLINYTVEFRLHAGTRPGSLGPPGGNDLRLGATGWQVDALQVSSVDFTVQPQHRVLPVADGARKQFILEVANQGPVPDTFHVRLDPEASSLPDAQWVQPELSQVMVNPGQRVRVPFTVDIPSDKAFSRGTYTAVISVVSERNPAIQNAARFDLQLDPNPLADLALQVSVEAEGTPPAFEMGTIVPIHATVHNLGQRPSPATTIRIVASDPDGETQAVGSALLPALCPLTTCGKEQSVGTATLEWMVPLQAGLYQLSAEADAEGLVLESRRDNNVRVLAARAVPLNRPDVRMDDLRVKGLSSDGFAEEGALVQVFANLTNVGNAPAEQVQVRILAGSAPLTDVVLPILVPGERRTVSAYKAAPAGQTVLSAIALLASGMETNVNNNELRRILNARGHDLGFTLDVTNVTVAGGAQATVMGTVHNRARTVERVVVTLDEPLLRQGWALAATPNPVVVAPNATSPVVLTLHAPEDARGGSMPLRVMARAVAKPSVQVNATLVAEIPLRAPAPGLAVANLTTLPGEALVPFTLRSNANAPQRLTVTLREPAWAAFPATVDLPAGGNLTGELLVAIPPGAAIGTHPVRVVATLAGDAAAEASGSIRVEGKMALAARWVQALPNHETLGSKQLAYALSAANAGNLPLRVRAVPADLPQGYAAEASESVLLLPGENATLALSVLASPDAPTAPAGRVEVWGIGADGTTEPLATLDLPALEATPNLVMARLEVSPRVPVSVGQEIRLMVRVENRGLAQSPAANLSGYVNGVLVQEAPLPPLAPGAWHETNLTWRASAAGRQLVTLLADGSHLVAEASEDDNGGSVEVTVERGLADALRLPAGGWGTLASLALALALVRPRRRQGWD